MFISLDLETTGTDPQKDKIIEFGAVKFDLNGNRETYQALLNPGIAIPEIITHITNISDKDVYGAPTIEEKFEEIKAFIGDLPIIGHNIKFDTGFLEGIGMELPNDKYDTYTLASIFLPKNPSYSLEVLSRVLGLEHKEKHRALDDSIAAMELFVKLCKIFKSLTPELQSKISNLTQKSDWETKNLFSFLTNGEVAGFKTQELQGHNEQEHEAQNIKEIDEPESIEPEEHNDSAKKIIELKESALIEYLPPYKALTLSLINISMTDNSTTNKPLNVAVPRPLFLELQKFLPKDLSTVDTAENYVSPKRLELFASKEKFKDYEICALIKYLIWIEQTETGLLRELHFSGTEHRTIGEICALDSNVENEPFIQKALKKNNNSPTLYTHEYLIQSCLNTDEVLILDFDYFKKRLFSNFSSFLNLNRLIDNFDPQVEITNRLELLAGLTGILFEKYLDPTSFNQKITLNAHIVLSKDFTQIKHLIQSLEEDFSAELGEYLSEIKEIFLNNDFENFLTTIERDYNTNDLFIKRSPLSLKMAFQSTVKNIATTKFIGEKFDLGDNGAYFKDLYGLNDDMAIINLLKYPQELEIYAISDMPAYETVKSKKEIQKILTLCFKNKGRSAVISGAKAILKELTFALSNTLKEIGITLVSQTIGNIGKIKEKFKENPDKSAILMTTGSFEQFENYNLIENLFIYKLPFTHPGDQYILSLSQGKTDPFNEIQLPEATLNLIRLINRQAQAKKANIFIMDSRLTQKDYGKIFMKNLQQISQLKIISLTQLTQYANPQEINNNDTNNGQATQLAIF